ncbi:pectin lyase fold/virulence factor [Tricladium varicosporioides]|nr:pectin lyase fold/virulence factor [Hymenoscyphus varicosporioides]
MTVPPFILVFCVALLAFISPISSHPKGNTIKVYEGQRIQAAVDSAREGDQILVGPGKYTEQLTITKSGISLIGHDATISPPTPPINNFCTGLAGNDRNNVATQVGICILGANVVLEPFVIEHRKVKSVGEYIEDVSVTGFTVSGFSGINIAIVGGKDVIVEQNKLADGGSYGALTVGSKDSNIKNNVVVSAAPTFIGICMDDFSPPNIAENDVSGQLIGLCIQTSRADIHDNHIHNTCVGAFVDPKIDGTKIRSNTFSNTLPFCPPGFAWGVRISGATNTVVKDNHISNIKIRADGTGAIGSGNMVVENIFKDNDIDIVISATGKENVARENQCSSSMPVDICAKK